MPQHETARALRAPAHVYDLLDRLHVLSLDQEKHLGLGNGGLSINKATEATRSDPVASKQAFDDKMRDKFIALTEDKADFVYQMIRAKAALTVVEAGTSFGVSTIYLSLAVGQNAIDAGKTPSEARVIATEFEPTKAAQARGYWAEAGEAVEKWIDLREGDILQTLREKVSDVDFVLFDIWTPLVLPTLKLLEPNLKPGAVIVADNVVSSKESYGDFLTYINRDGSPYSTVTLPYPGGLSLTTFNPTSAPATFSENETTKLFAAPGETGRVPEAGNSIRIARPSHDLVKAERFYVDGLGLEVLYRVNPEDEAQGNVGHVDHLLMLGFPGATWHLELVQDHPQGTRKACLPQPTDEDLLVVYTDGPIDPGALQRLVHAGGKEVKPKNPYWEQWGVTVKDPDGYRVVLSQRRWENAEVKARWIASE